MIKNFPDLIDGPTLVKLLAGGDDYIRTFGNEVKGLALNPRKNPAAPEVVIVGKGPKIMARARRFVESQAEVPVYIKVETGVWSFTGIYRAIEYSTDTADIATHGASRAPGSVSGILFLERCDSTDGEVVGGGFADPEARKETENAAVDYVKELLVAEGYAVRSVERENLGYDLHATRDDGCLLVEVKGTNFPVPRYFISRRENNCGQREVDWRLFVVTAARCPSRALHRYTYTQARAAFDFDPMIWKCVLV